MLKAGSLFSGAGLRDLGLSWAGFEHQWFCEIDPLCRAALARRWPDALPDGPSLVTPIKSAGQIRPQRGHGRRASKLWATA